MKNIKNNNLLLYSVFVISNLYAYNFNNIPNSNISPNPISTNSIDYNYSNNPVPTSSNYVKSRLQINVNKNVEHIPIKDNTIQNDYQKKIAPNPGPNYKQYFPTSKDEDDYNSSTPLVGNDAVPVKNITGSITTNHKIGQVKVLQKTDASGKVYFVDPKTGEPINITQQKDNNLTEDDYHMALKKYYESLSKLNQLKSEKVYSQENNQTQNNSDLDKQINNQQKIVLQNLDKAKELKYKEVEKIGGNAATIQQANSKTLNNAPATGSSVGNKFTSKVYSDFNFSSSESKTANDMIKNSQKMSDFYKGTYGTDITKLGRNSPVIKDKNVTYIINAYKAMDHLEDMVKNRLSSNIIQCYVSRELLPAYYCPIPGRDKITYPDYKHVKTLDDLKQTIATNPIDAKKTCNSLCFQKNSCIPYKILDNTHITAEKKSYLISPLKNDNYPVKVYIPLDGRMSVTRLNFTVKADVNTHNYKPSEHNNLTFLKYYNNLGATIKIKTDIFAYYKNKPAIPIVKNFIIEIKNGLIVNPFINLNMPMDGLVIYFKKPYFFNSNFKEINTPFVNNVLNKYLEDIKVENISTNYTSDSWWFCPFKQIVKDQTKCKTPLLELKNGESIVRICTDRAHRAGPDRQTGGFYSNESCKASCIDSEKCQVTYRHYKYITDLMGGVNGVYKIKVGCVKNDKNKNCTDKECKALFEDSKTRPNVEIVIQGDDTRVCTVRNKMLTGVLRPRINLDDELNATTSQEISNVFISEMKDAAFHDMIKNQNFNVIKKPIGTESPMQQAYNLIKYSNSHKQIDVQIKPDSFKYDDGKTYYLYSVLKIESIYRPEYGAFLMGANMAPSGGKIEGEKGTFENKSYFVDARNHPLVFKDLMYAVKDPSLKSGWKTFREQYFNQIRVTKLIETCYDASGKESNFDYKVGNNFTKCTQEQMYPSDGSQGQPKSCCFLTPKTRWVDYTGSHVDRNAFYDPNSDTFLTYDINNQLVPYYKKVNFTSDKIIYKYKILDNLFETPHDIPGMMFHSQIEKDHAQSFSRVFKGPWNTKNNSLLGDVILYNVYSDHKLTYAELLNKLKDKNNIFYDMYNAKLYSNKIISDSQFDNNIELYKLGNPNKISIQTHIKPKLEEENKKVFKFIFLKDFKNDPNAIKFDQINNYEEKNVTN